MPKRRSFFVLVLVLAGACASAPGRPRIEAEHVGGLDDRFVDWQPGAYTPAPQTRARTGESVAVAVSGGEEQARSAAVSMVQALLDADAPALSELFAERVVFVLSGTAQARSELIERCLRDTGALRYEPDLRVESIVDLAAIEVRRADRQHADVPLPPGIRPSDLMVTLPPPQGASADNLRRMPCLSGVYVRPGAHGAIVGLTR